ncbi:retrotrans_gag domain-containing protein [Trichonephila clavipes]|nr:retrotrans_gag domain-containing protein [Trichonephila clavipes]
MPTEQEAKPAVVTPSLQQWRSPSTFRGRLGKTLSNGLKMVCQQRRRLRFWEAFKNGLSGLFGDRQKYTRRAEEQLKCRAQRSGEYTVLHTKCIRTLPRGKSSDEEDEKVSHLMKGVAEDIYQALLTREINDTASFIKWCNYIEDMKQKRVGRPRFERLPNVVPVAS